MDFHRFLRALRRSWWLIIVISIAFAAVAYGYANSQPALFATRLTFYIGAPSAGDNNVNATNQYLQDHTPSYQGLLTSDELARLVHQQPGITVPVGEISSSITAATRLNTVLIDVTVTNSSKDDAIAIAQAVGATFPQMVNQLDNLAGRPATVKVSVVSGPSRPAVQIAPRTNLILAAGLVFGLIIGLVVAISRELLDLSARTADALGAASDVPVLGTFGLDRRIKSQPLLIGDAAHGPRAEALRQIRTNLQFIDVTVRARSVLLTSSVQGEGKSTISANLALSIAQTGRRVVLVEGDLRRPRFSRMFDIEGSLGVTNVLAGQVGLDDVLQAFGPNRLMVLPSGTVPPNPAELLGSPQMARLIDDLVERFDLVLIDSPPLLPVTDSALLAAVTDGVVVVYRSGKTRRWQLQSALRSLHAVNARVLGCVLNMKPVGRRERSGYGGYYAAGTPAETIVVDGARIAPGSTSPARTGPGPVDGAATKPEPARTSAEGPRRPVRASSGGARAPLPSAASRQPTAVNGTRAQPASESPRTADTGVPAPRA